MSAIRRFFNSDDENSVFKFTIDTTKIVSGATDGSQLNNQFIMPFNSTTNINAILKVSDGRADVVVTNANIDANKTLTFASPGIYSIELIGAATNIGFNQSVDKLKIIEINRFGYNITFFNSAFRNCTNLIISATNQPNLYGLMSNLFYQIKGFSSNVNLTTWDFSKAIQAPYMFYFVSNPMTSIPQGFINMSNIDRLYQGAPISTISKIEIISNTVITAQWLFYQTNYRGRIVFKTPNLTNISNFLYNITNPPPIGEVDIRKVTTTTNWITVVMSTANVDATLLGWVNNFDWSAIPTVANKVTFNFLNSKYSNNPTVIAAKAFLESKGIVFTNLTMA